MALSTDFKTRLESERNEMQMRHIFLLYAIASFGSRAKQKQKKMSAHIWRKILARKYADRIPIGRRARGRTDAALHGNSR